MLTAQKCFCRLPVLLLFLWVGVPVSISLAQQVAANGQATYNSACAGCHGLDGRGSDKAVNITGSAKMRHLTDVQLTDIIANGVPGTGMPGFRNLSERQIGAVVRYLRSLQGKTEARPLSGDPVRGRTIFFGKGECSNCHTMSGEGGFLGPDLSAYGASVSTNAVHDEIVRPQRRPAEGYRSAVLTTSAGERLEGLIRNEDNFSVQFQTRDGSFHFFQKSEIQKLEHLDASLMPTNYGERLSAAELNDLVSYLMSVAPEASKTRTTRKKKEDDFE
ncbi:MAG: c-type cytochrome [Candidatus Sulfotelmatobacter sp.]